MPSKWNDHASKYVKSAMRSAMAKARKTYKGPKKPTAAQQRSIKSLQRQRENINKRIKKMKNGGK